MRMIDVGGIKDSLLPELLSGVDGGTDDSWLKAYEVINRIENIVNEWVDNQPIVEAIPIEWIEEWGWKNGMSESMSLRVMIDDWEKENE